MSDNVINFPGETTLDIDPDKILAENMGKFSKAVIVAEDKETGGLCYFSSTADAATIIYYLESAKNCVLNMLNE